MAKGLEGLHLHSSPQPDYSIVQTVIIKPSAFHSLTTTMHPSNINLPSSVTAGLSAHEVTVTRRGGGDQDPLVRDITTHPINMNVYLKISSYSVPKS
jgi:hypothetical protein